MLKYKEVTPQTKEYIQPLFQEFLLILIRCAHCTDVWSAEMTRRHNNANVLALGAGVTGPKVAERMVEIFLNTEFEGGRHERRVNQLDAITP